MTTSFRQATQAPTVFNIELCEHFGLLPIDFDVRADSIYHPFNRVGNGHMEDARQRETR